MIEDLLSIPKLGICQQLFARGDFDFITIKDGKKHEKQEYALRILRDNSHTEIFYGGAAGGAKSWTGATFLGMMCECFPETKWFMAREELKKILETSYLTFKKVCKRYGINDWRLDGKYNYIDFKNGSRIDLLDLKYLPAEDPLYERFGSAEYTGGWIDEAGQAHDGAYDVLKTRVGRHLNDYYGLLRKLFLSGNPKKNFLYREFYRKDKEGVLEAYKIFIKSLLHDNPHRETGYEDALRSLNSEVTKQRLLYGNFEYDDDPATLIDYEKILDCFTNTWIAVSGRSHITCDVARFGTDKTVIGVWNGWGVRLYAFHGLSISQTAAKIKEYQERFRIGNSDTIADEDGVGGGVVDILGCRGFVNNSRPIEVPGREQENFSNLKSQCYFHLAERINKGGVYIECGNPEMKATIIEELEQVKQYNMDKDSKRAVLPKDKVKELIGRSPDFADTIMMREWFELAPQYSWVAF